MGHKIVVAKVVLEDLYFSKQLNLREISRQCGYSRNTISRIFNDLGIPLTRNKRKNVHRLFVTYPTPSKADLENLYFSKQKSIRDICKLYCSDFKTIIGLFVKYEIPRRSGREAWKIRKIIKTPPQVSSGTLYDDYVLGKLNSYDIAEKYGIPSRTVRRYLSRYRIPVRTRCPNKDTSIELRVEDELAAREIGHYKQFYIKDTCIADKAFPDEKIAIFCDGDYWHSKPAIAEKDIRVNRILREKGWIVLRFSEHEIKKDIATVMQTIIQTLAARRAPTNLV